MKTYALLTVMLLLTSFAEAKNLYVDSALGNDATTYAANDATHPWATLGRAVWGSTLRTTPNASQAAQAGDTVNVRAGIYTTDQGTGIRYMPIYNPVNSGTPGNYITFRCESGRCELRANTSTVGEPIAGANQRSYIKWIGFYVDQNNMNFGGDSGMMVAWSSSYVELHGNELQARYYDTGGAANNHSCIRIEESQNVLVKNNKLYGSTGNSTRNDSAIHIYTSGNVIIENNEVFNCFTGIFMKQPITPSPLGSNGLITVRYNLIYGILGDAICVHRAIDGRIYQNVVHDSSSGITWFGFSDPTPQNYIIANNTIHNCTKGIYIKPTGTPGFVNDSTWNNIVTNSTYAIQAEDVPTATTPDFEHNVYYNFTTFARVYYVNYTFSTWKSTFSQDSVLPASLNSDPLYVDASRGLFKLQPSSPARNVGIDILDLNGNGSTTDVIPAGAYITGNERIGRISAPHLY